MSTTTSGSMCLSQDCKPPSVTALFECLCAVLRCEGLCRAVQAEVYSLIKDWTLDEHNHLREHVPETGLRTNGMFRVCVCCAEM